MMEVKMNNESTPEEQEAHIYEIKIIMDMYLQDLENDPVDDKLMADQELMNRFYRVIERYNNDVSKDYVAQLTHTEIEDGADSNEKNATVGIQMSPKQLN